MEESGPGPNEDLAFKSSIFDRPAVSASTWGSPMTMSRSMGDIKIKRKTATPIMHNVSTHGSTWYCGGSSAQSGSSKHSSCWRPLGASWREWEDESLSRIRSDVDDGEQFIHGCVPHWGKEVSIRMHSVIEHELTWAYYRMRRHAEHPLRKEVGDTLPNAAVSENMRFGRKNRFQFWIDLRPPFTVLNVKKADEMPASSSSVKMAVPHPDGELYKVTYQCGIEYSAERLTHGGENGTFGSKITGVALIRISNSFPRKRPLRIISWGQPQLNGDEPADDDDDDGKKAAGVDPNAFLPIGHELGKRPNDPSMAACRSVTRELTMKMAKRRTQVDVPELQKLLLGPHASLPRLAQCERAARGGTEDRQPPGLGSTSAASTRSATRRQHTIWTQAAGFIRYTG